MSDITTCAWYNLMCSTDNLYGVMSWIGLDVKSNPSWVLKYCDYMTGEEEIPGSVFAGQVHVFDYMTPNANNFPTLLWEYINYSSRANYEFTTAILPEIASGLYTEMHYAHFNTEDEYLASIEENTLFGLPFFPWNTYIVKYPCSGPTGYISKRKADGTQILWNPLQGEPLKMKIKTVSILLAGGAGAALLYVIASRLLRKLL